MKSTFQYFKTEWCVVSACVMYVCVQYGDCLWKKAVPKSVCSGFRGAEPPARGKQVKKRKSRKGGSDDAGHSVEAL